MNPRNLLSTVATLIALVAVGITAGAAQAEPQRELVTGEITVEVHAGGTVTGTGINCGIDCYDSRSWYDDEVPPTNRLTATPGTGWAFGGWQGCTSVNGQSNKCDASYSEFGSEPIIAAFYDVMAPSVYLHYPASDQVVGSSMYAGLSVNSEIVGTGNSNRSSMPSKAPREAKISNKTLRLMPTLGAGEDRPDRVFFSSPCKRGGVVPMGAWTGSSRSGKASSSGFKSRLTNHSRHSNRFPTRVARVRARDREWPAGRPRAGFHLASPRACKGDSDEA